MVLAGHSVTNMEVGVVEKARAVEARAAVAVEVELDGGTLPCAAERIDDVEVDLGAVEGAVAVVDDEGDAVGVE